MGFPPLVWRATCGSRAEAAAFIEAYLSASPVSGTIWKRRRRRDASRLCRDALWPSYPPAGLYRQKPSVRSFAERQAINALIQGTAADIIKRAMARLPAQLADLPATMLLQVHDELIFEVADAAVEEASARSKR